MRYFFLAYGIAVTGRYIVMFNLPNNPSLSRVRAQCLDNTENTKKLFTPSDKIEKLLINGYYATLTKDTLDKIRADPAVAAVEEDMPVHLEFKSENIQQPIMDYTETALDPKYTNQGELMLQFRFQGNAPWGISSISGHDKEYEYYEGLGRGVDAYVIDTGIDVGHREFTGRARWGYNAVAGSPDKDENGHGTHCAGTIGGSTFGIAKNINLIAVKTLGKDGSGMTSSLIEGIDFVMKDHERRLEEHYAAVGKQFFKGDGYLLKGGLQEMFDKEKPRAVVSISISGLKSEVLNFAVKYASRFLGIHFVTAAGNEHQNACLFSPASAPRSITVGACDSNYEVAGFSNVGSCVNIYAPGVDIISAWPDNGIRSASGTSMATPHVAGVLAAYLSLVDLPPKELKSRILTDSLKIVRSPVVPLNSSFLFSDLMLGPLGSMDWKGYEGDLRPAVSLKKLYERLKEKE